MKVAINRISFKVALFSIILCCLLSVSHVHAQSPSFSTSVPQTMPATSIPIDGAGGDIQRNLTIFSFIAGLPNVDIGTFFGRIIRLVIGFIGIILVLLVIYSGLVWMTSGGDEEKVAKAKKTLVNAIVGLIIILSANSIVNFLIRQLTATTGSTETSPSPPAL